MEVATQAKNRTAATTDVNLEQVPASNSGDSNANASDMTANVPVVAQAPPVPQQLVAQAVI